MSSKKPTSFKKKQSDDLFNRLKGMILGGALGDALGAPHEFRYQKKDYTGKMEKTLILQSRWQGKRTGVIGQITDDTEMTLCLWRSIFVNNDYDRRQALMNYLEWANSKTWAMGRNTRALLLGVKTEKGYNGRVAKQDKNDISQSNGCLMRCSPLAILGVTGKDWRTAVDQDCNLTNPTAVSYTHLTLPTICSV